MGLLETIKDELWKGCTMKEVEVAGHRWKLKSLNDGETVWRDKFVQVSASYSVVTGSKAPTVAVSLVEIDGIPVRELFLEDEEKKNAANEVVREWMRMVGFASERERFEVAERIYKWLSELPPEVVDELYNHCLELEKVRRDAVLALLKKR